MGFRTRVRLPSGPLKSQASNTARGCKFAVYRNEFALIIDINQYEADCCDDAGTITFASIQDNVSKRYGIKICKSTITQVKTKCGLKSFDVSQVVAVPEDVGVRSEKEKMVLKVFRELGLVK